MATVGPFSKFSAESPPFNPQSIAAGGSTTTISTIGVGSNNNMYQQQQYPQRTGVSPMSSRQSSAGNTGQSSSQSLSSSRSNSPYPYGANGGTTILGVAEQLQQQHNGGGTTTTTTSNGTGTQRGTKNSNAVPKYTFVHGGKTLEIRNVWADNVEEEMAAIRELVEQYPYIAMDTEFPGVVAKPVITDTYTPDYHYRSLKINVDLLKIIQLGLSFADESGQLAPTCPCWQFNFKFDLDDDMFAQDSIDLLNNSGISFEDHAKRGIDPLVFGELLIVSGLVLHDKVKWVSFHSGYDYGYLLKLLTTTELPNDEKSFFELLKIYFPTIYDVKYMTSLLDGHQFMGGLQRLADDLQCQRMGVEHQAGSDSLLTMSSFFALMKAKFGARHKDSTNLSSILLYDDTKFANELFGYGTNHTVRKIPPSTNVSTSSVGANTAASVMMNYNSIGQANTTNYLSMERSTATALSTNSNE